MPPSNASPMRSSEVMTARSPPSSTKRTAASILGPMLPRAKWPSACSARIPSGVTRPIGRSSGVPYPANAQATLVAITSVVLVIFYGQTRIFFAMCRDGLMPRRLAAVNQRYGTPARLTVILGVLISILAALVPLGTIVELVNIGTLFAFVLVNIGVIVLRRTRPDMPRPYRVPWSPLLPIIGVLFAAYLMADLPLDTWIRFLGWLAVGLLIYAAYGYRHSRLRRPADPVPSAGATFTRPETRPEEPLQGDEEERS